MSKTYLANTPLILQDENGEYIRIERGATVVLSNTQYTQVAAHVTLIAEPETQTQPETDTSTEIQSQPEAETQVKSQPTKTSRGKKAADKAE